VSRRQRPPLAAVSAALGIFLLTGCFSSSSGVRHGTSTAPGTDAATSGSSGEQNVEIDGNDSQRFTPSTVIVNVGVVRLTFKNVGRTPHTLTSRDLGVDTGNVMGGQSKALVVNIPRPGRYKFYCDYHKMAGMTGTITAKS
jgi:plastocyanin